MVPLSHPLGAEPLLLQENNYLLRGYQQRTRYQTKGIIASGLPCTSPSSRCAAMQTCAELAMVVSDCQYVARECKPTTFNSSFIVTCNISDVMTFENITRTPPAISHEMTTEQANVDWVYLLWGFSCLHCCAPLKLVNPILARSYESTSLKLINYACVMRVHTLSCISLKTKFHPSIASQRMPFPRLHPQYHYPEGSTFPQDKHWEDCSRS